MDRRRVGLEEELAQAVRQGREAARFWFFCMLAAVLGFPLLVLAVFLVLLWAWTVTGGRPF